MIYLIHFEGSLGNGPSPLGSAQHYIGWTNDLSQTALVERMRQHRAGQGARILRAANQAGISWKLVALYRGSRVDERRLKNHKRARDFCPRCSDLNRADRSPSGRLLDQLEHMSLAHLYAGLREFM